MINNVERIKKFKEEKMFRVFLYKKIHSLWEKKNKNGFWTL